MKRFALFLFMCVLIVPAWASDDDNDTTPIAMCSSLPEAAKIELLTLDKAKQICRAMNLLPDIRVKDVRVFSKAYAILVYEGYEGSIDSITKQLVQIVKLRGLNEQPARWYDEINLIIKTYQGLNGVVTPIDAVQFL